jgi:DNA (cytosine-5)-methyltransferase 1
VFVVGHLGDWRPSAKVLFESHSLSGYSKKSGQKGEEVATFVESSFGTFREDKIGGTTKASGGVLGGGSETLVATENKVPLAHAFKVRGGCAGGGKGYLGKDEKAFTLSTMHDQQIFQNMAVRRLTEIECERLQGFPDNYTNIKENCPSGARYKALGNSMAVPVMKWIGKRIQMVEDGLI